MQFPRGDEAMALLLLENNADPNLKSRISETPLEVAASKGHERLVKLLLKTGPDIYYEPGAQPQIPSSETKYSRHYNKRTTEKNVCAYHDTEKGADAIAVDNESLLLQT